MKYTTCLLKRYGKALLVCLAAAVGAAVMLGSSCSVLNKAPTVPVISGPSAGVVGVPVTFKATATDPESDSIAFQFDWGDTSAPAWHGLVASGETVSAQHTYSDSGLHFVKAKSKDAKGKESDWSAAESCRASALQLSWPDSLIGEIPLDATVDRCVATPDGRFLYVTHRNAGFVTPIRLCDRSVLPHIATDAGPYCLTATPDSRWVYVTCTGNSTVAVIRTSDNNVVKHVLVGRVPKGISTGPDGERVYVAVSDSKTLSIIRTDDHTIEDSVSLEHEPFDVAVSPSGSTAYVSLIADDLLGCVDLPGLALTGVVDVGSFAKWLDMSPDGKSVYVTNHSDSGVAVVSTSDFAVSAHIGLADEYVGDIAVAPNGSYLVASCWSGVKCVALPFCAVVDSTSSGARGGLAFSSDGETLYVATGHEILVLGNRVSRTQR